jgi:hypothetical protein
MVSDQSTEQQQGVTLSRQTERRTWQQFPHVPAQAFVCQALHNSPEPQPVSQTSSRWARTLPPALACSPPRLNHLSCTWHPAAHHSALSCSCSAQTRVNNAQGILQKEPRMCHTGMLVLDIFLFLLYVSIAAAVNLPCSIGKWSTFFWFYLIAVILGIGWTSSCHAKCGLSCFPSSRQMRPKPVDTTEAAAKVSALLVSFRQFLGM